jgi:hypothetical protein
MLLYLPHSIANTPVGHRGASPCGKFEGDLGHVACMACWRFFSLLALVHLLESSSMPRIP